MITNCITTNGITLPTPGELADELESGAWVRGECALRQVVDGTVVHCCLGVLRERAGRDRHGAYLIPSAPGQEMLDDDVIRDTWLGLKGVQISLSQANDGEEPIPGKWSSPHDGGTVIRLLRGLEYERIEASR